jgi:hypothetical protein
MESISCFLRLGKLFQKFIVLDIIKIALSTDEAHLLMHNLNKNSRKFFNVNYEIIEEMFLQNEKLELYDITSYHSCIYLKHRKKYFYEV